MYLLLVACPVYMEFHIARKLALALIVSQDEPFDGWSRLLIKLSQWWVNTTIGCLNPPVMQLESMYLDWAQNTDRSFVRQDRLNCCYAELI